MSTDLPHVNKFPVLIPPSHLTTLIIRDCHESVMHNGVKETLLEFRTRFWLVRGRQIVKKEIAKCDIFGRHEELTLPFTTHSSAAPF